MAGNHPHLVSLIGYCIKPTQPTCILLEYMQGGDLLTYLHDQRKQQKNETNNYKPGQYTGETLPLKRTHVYLLEIVSHFLIVLLYKCQRVS